MSENAQNNKRTVKPEVNDRLEWLRTKGFIKTLEFRNDKGQVVGTTEAVSYQGLLALAHEDGLKRVFTEVVQLPTKENEKTAVVLAEVETKKGTFRDYGDANPQNVNYKIAPHIIRMASTRSKARAFRDAVDIGVVCAEELDLEVGSNGALVTRATNGKLKMFKGEKADEEPNTLPPAATDPSPEKPKSAAAKRNGNGQKASPKPNGNSETQPPDAKPDQTTSSPVSGDLITDRQRNYLFRLVSNLGYEDKQSHEFLKERLGVRSLKEVTKWAAGKLIEQLLKEAKQSPRAKGVPS